MTTPSPAAMERTNQPFIHCIVAAGSDQEAAEVDRLEAVIGENEDSAELDYLHVRQGEIKGIAKTNPCNG